MMKYVVSAFVLVLGVVEPVVAQSPDGPAGAQSQLERARVSALESLSAMHRDAIAHIIGDFAVATVADAGRAASNIDDVLSASEKSAVLAAAQPVRSQLHLEHYNPGGPMVPVGGTPAPLPPGSPTLPLDPGRALLDLALQSNV